MITQDQLFNRLAGIATLHRNKHSHSRGSYMSEFRHQFEQDFGYSVLGGGFFSLVIEHPDDPAKVIKMGFGGGFDRPYKDDGWLMLAMYAMKHPAPCLPVIHGIKCYENFFLVEMERLEEFKPEGNAELMRTHSMLKDFAYIRTPLRPTSVLTMEDIDAVNIMCEELGSFQDYHTGNVMMRGEQVVFTDVYSRCNNSRDYYFERYKKPCGTIDIEVYREPVNENTAGPIDGPLQIMRGFDHGIRPRRNAFDVPNNWFNVSRADLIGKQFKVQMEKPRGMDEKLHLTWNPFEEPKLQFASRIKSCLKGNDRMIVNPRPRGKRDMACKWPMLHVDMNDMEARVAGQLAPNFIHAMDEAQLRKIWEPGLNAMDKVRGHHGILANKSKTASIRTAHKDTVLPHGQLNAHRAQRFDVQRVLLSMSESTVRTSRRVIPPRIRGKEASFIIADDIFEAPTPKRRNTRIGPVARRSECLATEGRNTVDAGKPLQDCLQQAAEPGVRTRIREWFAGGPDHAQHRRHKAEVHSKEPR